MRGDLLALVSTLAQVAAAEGSSTFVSLLYASQHDGVLVPPCANGYWGGAVASARRSSRVLSSEASCLPMHAFQMRTRCSISCSGRSSRYVVRGLPLDRAYLRRFVELILLPSLTGSAGVRP